MNDIQWRFEALTYLTSILQVNQKAHARGSEMRTTGEAYPKIWAYLGFRNLLTRYEMDTGEEDRYMSAEAQFKATERTHANWQAQQK